MAPRFAVDRLPPAGTSETLSDADAHHAFDVLRLRDGTAVELFDGRGLRCAATLRRSGRHGAQVTADGPAHAGPRPALALTLAQGIASNDRMDWIVEKAVELGVARIVPLLCARSVVRLDESRRLRRLARWQEVARAACRQCGEDRFPDIATPVALRDWLAGLPAPGQDPAGPPADAAFGTRLLCHPTPDAMPLAARAGAAGAYALLIGPEGGFTPREQSLVTEAISLGPHVMRAETAAMVGGAQLVALREYGERGDHGELSSGVTLH